MWILNGHSLGLSLNPDFLGENVLNIGLVTEAEPAQTGQLTVSSEMHGYGGDGDGYKCHYKGG
jgi:hypothetical protein